MRLGQRALLVSILSLALSGCAFIGVAAHTLKPPEVIKPEYTGLAGQTVGVMVWAQKGIRIDWPTVQLDIANAVQAKMTEAIAHDKDKKMFKGTTLPVQPASIVRYQQDHPEMEAQAITEVAPKLGVNRLIYVELQDFATRSDMSVDLFRGTAQASVQLIEVHDGQGKLAWEKDNLKASFPPKGPQEGMPGVGDAKTYAGTIDAISTEIAHQFVPYEVEE